MGRNVSDHPNPNWKALVDRAVEVVGNDQKLADRIGCSRQWVARMRDRSVKGAKNISAAHAKAIETATAGVVTRHELRPDIFDAPPVSEGA